VARALFAYGDAEMNLDSDETNHLSHLNEAIRIFKQILQISATNQLAADALGGIGNCYLQWAAKDPAKYADAADYYQQVAGAPYASVTARSQSKVGLGRVAEGMAGQKNGAEQVALLKQALEDYLDVFFYQNDLRDGEQPDLFWVKEAGLKAARLAESLQEWKTAYTIYRRLESLYPPWSSILEPRILKIVKTHPELSPEK
jgi:tetratricopeptide (TPR) repeat protein